MNKSSCESGSAVTPSPINCDTNQFKCARNGIVECWPNSWKCDGYIDCDDAYDELGCPTVTPAPDVTTPNQNTGKCQPNQVR